MEPTAQQKMEAWMRVAKLVREAQAVLVDAEEGPMEQAKLDWIEDKARVQAQLWNVPKSA